LYEKIDGIRKGRNNLIHQLWLYAHRDDFHELRRKLDDLAGVANELVGISNRLTQEIGMEEIWEMSLKEQRK